MSKTADASLPCSLHPQPRQFCHYFSKLLVYVPAYKTAHITHEKGVDFSYEFGTKRNLQKTNRQFPARNEKEQKFITTKTTQQLSMFHVKPSATQNLPNDQTIHKRVNKWQNQRESFSQNLLKSKIEAQKVVWLGFFLDLGLLICFVIISGQETSRGGREHSESKKNKKRELFTSGAAAQPRWLADHRAGTASLTGEDGGDRNRILESLSRKREERERTWKNDKKSKTGLYIANTELVRFT